MDNNEVRLQKCFSKVFPDLSPQAISNASTDTVRGWDSIASITLLMLVQEEFGVVPDMDRFEEFTSYQGLLGYIGEASANG